MLKNYKSGYGSTRHVIKKENRLFIINFFSTFILFNYYYKIRECKLFKIKFNEYL